MAKERTSVRMKEQIKIMHVQGISIRRIAKALGVSRKTVRKVLGIADLPKATALAPWIGPVDWDYVRGEVGRGCTIKQIHREVAPDVAYLAFWRTYRDKVPVVPVVTMRLHHKPADKTEISLRKK